MESTTVFGLRSRSRSKTPFLRSSSDREIRGDGGEEHTHKSGRKTPSKRSTPVKQLNNPKHHALSEPIREEAEPTPARSRQSMRISEKLIKTSDYSSEESIDRLRGHTKEVMQNEVNNRYEQVSTSSHHNRHYSTLADVSLSPIGLGYNVTNDERSRYDSYSACSTDSSFAEQALADASILLERDPVCEHLPYRLYKMAGEYWNKYPKTDYTYSPLSKDRVELAPGQVAVPNMSRRSLSQFRLHGPNTSVDEADRMAATAAWTSSTRKRFTTVESSDDEGYAHNGYHRVDDRWWITRLLITIMTTVTSTVSTAYRAVVGPEHRYPYTERRPQVSFTTRASSAAAAPFYWIYTLIKKVVTTTVTTITETITPNHVSETETYTRLRQQQQQESRRWWPWLLLLLLPLFVYGCYNSDVMQPQEPVIVDTYKPPKIMQSPDLSKRMAALEHWAMNVDSKLKLMDSKISKLDNLEATIEQYSLKHMQQNFISIFNVNENSDAITRKLKDYFDSQYVTKDQMSVISQEIHERLINSWKPDMDEEKIRQTIQEYLAVFEKRQMELILERVKEYVKVVEKEVDCKETGFDAEAVKKIVAEMLQVYDADKTGVVDYAVESAGGQVLSTRCTELYQIKTKQYSILGLPVWWVYTSPRHALTPGTMPAECWAFQGFPGYLVIRLFAVIEVTSFSMEHMSRMLAPDGKIESAPKNFSVYGLHSESDPDPHLFGEYMYDNYGTAIQYFPVQRPKTTNIGGKEYPVAYDIIELRIQNNHGNPTYTCLYRFRVHGNPLSDIRQATEDNMIDS